MGIIEQTEPPVKKLDKKPVERSVSYPGITIEEALIFTDKVSKNFTPSQIISREDIGAVLNTSANTIVREVAACVNYGLFLKQQKEGYQISTRYKTFTNSLSANEKRKFLLDAFQSPKLYIDLIKKFDGHTIPNEFKTHLIRFHKIAENAANLAAEIFIKNAKFCGILNEYNILTFKLSYDQLLSDADIQFEEQLERINKQDEMGNSQDTKQNEKPKTPLLLNEINNKVDKKITLTDGKISIWQYPKNLNKKDIEIFRKEIEILELILP